MSSGVICSLRLGLGTHLFVKVPRPGDVFEKTANKKDIEMFKKNILLLLLSKTHKSIRFHKIKRS